MDAQYALDDYWEVVRAAVCTKCIDGDGRGNCRLTGSYACGLSAHFPRIVETVLSVKSDVMDPYIDALRKNVCVNCVHQSPDGTCMFRASVDCGLDRYFPLIVQAIEGLQQQSYLHQKGA